MPTQLFPAFHFYGDFKRRYETFWTGFMADELALCPNTLVVAHGTAADAVLRFVETHEAI